MQRHLLNRPGSGQRGVVLILAIVVLVAMSLAALALMRSVNTGNRVAGNLAFQQSATLSADAGVETAVQWLEANRISGALFNDATIGGTSTVGYFSKRADPSSTQTWETWWSSLPANQINKLAADSSNNTVSYIIQRLCNAAGDPATNIGCQTAPSVDPNQGGSKGAGGNNPVVAVVQYYYRITSRVAGVRGTVSYVQVVVAM
jgi:Tfp pilus assembly protein PilX